MAAIAVAFMLASGERLLAQDAPDQPSAYPLPNKASPPADGPPRILRPKPLIDKKMLEWRGQAEAEPRIVPNKIEERPAGDAANGGEQAEQGGETPPSMLPGAVSVTALSESDIAAIGVLTQESGGLPPNLWQGSPMAEALDAIKALPASNRSAVMQNLMRRLLLTAAPPPEQGDGRGWEFMTLRLRKLAEIGHLRDLTALMDRLPLANAPRDVVQLAAEAYLYAGDFASACDIATWSVDNDRSGYWLQLIAACRALSGDRPGAQLALDIMSDSGMNGGFYSRLMERLLNRPLKTAATRLDMAALAPEPPLIWPADAAATPIDFALAQLLGVDIPLMAVDRAGPLAQTAVAISPFLAPDKRLAMAERIMDRAVMRPADFRALLAAVDSAAPAEEDLAAAPEPMARALGRAAFYQRAAAAPDVKSRLDALGDYWRAARDEGALPAAAKASMTLLDGVEPSAELLAWAPEISRALALGGDSAGLSGWYRFIRMSTQDGDPDMAGRLLDIWALALVADADGNVPYSDQILSLWYQSSSGRDAGQRANEALFFFSVLEGLGYTVAPEIWQQLSDLGANIMTRTPADSEWNALITAAGAGRMGDTVAYAAAAMGNGDVAGVEAETLRSILESLREVGLEREARRLAAEALVMRGF